MILILQKCSVVHDMKRGVEFPFSRADTAVRFFNLISSPSTISDYMYKYTSLKFVFCILLQ